MICFQGMMFGLGTLPTGASVEGPIPIPHPDLSALEGAVAEQLGDARELLESTVEAGAEPRDLAAVHGELARLYHAYDFPEAAGAAYANAQRLAPGDFRWPYYLGHLAQQAGELAGAEKRYRESLAFEADYVPALVHLAEVRLAQGEPAEASELLSRALELEPACTAARAVQGEIALAEKRYSEAVGLLTEALEAVPEADRLHYPLALAYRGLGRTEKAREHLARRGTVGLKPQDPLLDELQEVKVGERVHLLRGRRAFQAGDYAAAAELFRRAVEARPESVRARVNLGAALGQVGDLPGAVAEYRKVLELEPDNATARFNLGILHVRQGSLEQAAGHLAEAARLAPEDAVVRHELGDVLASLGRAGAAAQRYRQAREIDPADEDAWLGEAQALVRQGSYGEAKSCLERAHEQLPDRGGIAHALARLLAASPDPTQRDGERALDLAMRVFEARSSVTHAETVAMALAEQGRCEDAARWQSRAVTAAREAGQGERAESLEGTLAHYTRSVPCRFLESAHPAAQAGEPTHEGG